MQLTEHFNIYEFERSSVAARRGIDNTVPRDMLPSVQTTAAMLERIRNRLWVSFGREVPLQITSGYRCPALNRAIGSRDSSDHVRGMAADFVAAAGVPSPEDIARHLLPWVDDLGVGQLVLEYPRSAGGGWVHVSTRQPALAINRAIAIHGPGQIEPLVA